MIFPNHVAEEGVSIRAIQRRYCEQTSDTRTLSLLDIFEIAEGIQNGSPEAAKTAFAEMGEAASDAIAHAITIVDGVVTTGGGLSKASKYIIPSLMKELRSTLTTSSGASFGRIQSHAYYIDNPNELELFLTNTTQKIQVPHSDKNIECNLNKQIAIILSTIGTSRAISLGVYAFALNQIDKIK